MAESTYGFRSALGGFHKGDVIGYIEKAASQHRSQLLEYEQTLTALREENRALQQQLSLLMMATPLASELTPAPAAEEAPAPAPAIEEAPEPEAAPAPEAAPTPVEVLSPVLDADKEALLWQELQAYRRAEAVERKATARVKNLYQQLDGLCDGTLAEFQSTNAAVKQTIELLLSQAQLLEQSYTALSDSLLSSREKLVAANGQLRLDSEE